MVQVADPGRDTVRLESRACGRSSRRGQAVVVGGWPEDGGRAAGTPKGPSAGSRGEQVDGKGSEDPLLVLSDPTLGWRLGSLAVPSRYCIGVADWPERSFWLQAAVSLLW